MARIATKLRISRIVLLGAAALVVVMLVPGAARAGMFTEPIVVGIGGGGTTGGDPGGSGGVFDLATAGNGDQASDLIESVSLGKVDRIRIWHVPVNITPPVISGTAQVGQELTCSPGTWAYSPTSLAYRWRRDGVNISGATLSTYTVVEDDVATELTCRVTATNPAGSRSAASAAVVPLPLAPVNTVPPVISGTAQVDQQLACSEGTWDHEPVSFAYQWRRDGVNIDGADTATYTVAEDDVGQDLTCQVTATNAGGSGTATSAAVNPVPLPPARRAPDTTAPVTTIRSGPRTYTRRISATFEFNANESRVGFECRLDDEEWVACGSPEVVYGLMVGKHRFLVRAQDRAGNTGQSATWTWTVDRRAPRLRRASIRANVRVRRFALRRISGIAVDDLAGVSSVKIKLRIMNKRTRRGRGSCAFLSLKSGRRIVHPCNRGFTRVKGARRWHLKVRKSVRNRFRSEDHYMLLIRTRDFAGNSRIYRRSFKVRRS